MRDRVGKRENGEQESAFCHRCCCFSALTNNTHTHTQYLCHCSFLCLTTASLLLLLSLPVLVQHTPRPPRPAPPLICHSLSPDCLSLSLRVFTITINFDFIIPTIIIRTARVWTPLSSSGQSASAAVITTSSDTLDHHHHPGALVLSTDRL